METLFNVSITPSVWMFLGVLLYATNDALLKYSATTLPAGEILFFRSLCSLSLMFMTFKVSDWVELSNTKDKPIHLLRAFFSAISLICTIIALKIMTLASFEAIFYISPLLLAVLAFLILGEPWNNKILSNLALGFLGVLLVVGPGKDIFGSGVPWALGGAFFYALTLVCAKKVHKSPLKSLYGSYIICYIPLTALTLPFFYVPIQPSDMLVLFTMAVIHYGAFLCYAKALSRSAVSHLVGMEYVGLVVAIILGYIVFEEIPTWLILAGGGLLVWSNVRLKRVQK